jgi:hypothetical protein
MALAASSSQPGIDGSPLLGGTALADGRPNPGTVLGEVDKTSELEIRPVTDRMPVARRRARQARTKGSLRGGLAAVRSSGVS